MGKLQGKVAVITGGSSGMGLATAKLADLDRLYGSVKSIKGHVDVVFANAGVGELLPLGAITEQHFDQLFNVNVRGTLFTEQKALRLLRDDG
jgi:NAD(P)-dependent dehydrogenase (short-subunit alcohol dehydrogenase family)